VIETSEGILAKGMRQVNGAYPRYSNRRHERVGHLFQGQGILAAFLLVSTLVGCSREQSSSSPQVSQSENSVVAFLRNAERQSETDDQRKEIQRALRDMLERSPVELKRLRYADYGGQPNVWSVTQLLQHYFVPSPLATLDEERFFQDFSSPEAREVIKQQLDAVTTALKEETKSAN